MGFYYCSGIFLCFMYVTALPIFSTGMPCSVKETTNNESNQNNGPAKDLETDISDYSDENDEVPDNLLKELLIPSNEEMYPIAFYSSQAAFNGYKEYANNKGQISALKVLEIANERNAADNGSSTEINDIDGDEMINLSELLMFIFNKMKNLEEDFNTLLSKGDEKNNGFVSNEYAKEVLLKSQLLGGQITGKLLDNLLKKYTNENNQFNYLEMKKNTLDNAGEYQSDVYSYNYEKKKWVRKYKYTPTYCL